MSTVVTLGAQPLQTRLVNREDCLTFPDNHATRGGGFIEHIVQGDDGDSQSGIQ